MNESESDFPAGTSDMMGGIESGRDDLDDNEESIHSPDVNAQLEDENGMEMMDGEDSDAIDINNPEDLERRGLKRIQIEDADEEFLLDKEGNIYNLLGEFVGTMDGEN